MKTKTALVCNTETGGNLLRALISSRHLHVHVYTSIKIIKNEVGCRDDTVPKTADTRRHCEEE